MYPSVMNINQLKFGMTVHFRLNKIKYNIQIVARDNVFTFFGPKRLPIHELNNSIMNNRHKFTTIYYANMIIFTVSYMN